MKFMILAVTLMFTNLSHAWVRHMECTDTGHRTKIQFSYNTGKLVDNKAPSLLIISQFNTDYGVWQPELVSTEALLSVEKFQDKDQFGEPILLKGQLLFKNKFIAFEIDPSTIAELPRDVSTSVGVLRSDLESLTPVLSDRFNCQQSGSRARGGFTGSN